MRSPSAFLHFARDIFIGRGHRVARLMHPLRPSLRLAVHATALPARIAFADAVASLRCASNHRVAFVTLTTESAGQRTFPFLPHSSFNFKSKISAHPATWSPQLNGGSLQPGRRRLSTSEQELSSTLLALTAERTQQRRAHLNIAGMAKPEILVVGKQLAKMESDLAQFATLHRLDGQVDQSQRLLAEIGPRIQGVATSSFVGFPSELFDSLPALKIISCFGVGTDKIDVAGASERGIVVTNTPDVLTDDVADLALALLLAVSRRICEADRYVREKQWPLHGMMPLTRKVSGKRVGILGMGRIGLAIAKRAEAFGCQISYQSRSKKPDLSYTFFSSPVELARQSDFLVAACPLTPATTHIVNKDVMDALGPEGVLVNIARGAVVDEAELVKALVEGRLGGAGMDVFENEPHVPDELLSLPQVVLLPHVGSGTQETRADMADVTVANLRAHFSGQPLLTPVNA